MSKGNELMDQFNQAHNNLSKYFLEVIEEASENASLRHLNVYDMREYYWDVNGGEEVHFANTPEDLFGDDERYASEINSNYYGGIYEQTDLIAIMVYEDDRSHSLLIFDKEKRVDVED